MSDVFIAGVSSESVKQGICRAFGVATKAGRDFSLESAVDAASMEQQALDTTLSLFFPVKAESVVTTDILYRLKLHFHFISSFFHL